MFTFSYKIRINGQSNTRTPYTRRPREQNTYHRYIDLLLQASQLAEARPNIDMVPLKLAIIGAGPSSFYVASRLLSLFPHGSSQLKIHMYDRLWAPHGLVRYGVAPDHPEVKLFQ